MWRVATGQTDLYHCPLKPFEIHPTKNAIVKEKIKCCRKALNILKLQFSGIRKHDDDE